MSSGGVSLRSRVLVSAVEAARNLEVRKGQLFSAAWNFISHTVKPLLSRLLLSGNLPQPGS